MKFEKRGRVLAVLFFLVIFLGLSLVSASFNITGYTKGINAGGRIVDLNSTNISVEIYQLNLNGPPSLITAISNLSNESGYFYTEINDTYAENKNLMYKISLVKYNNDGLAEYIGPNLPYFPAEQLDHLGTVYFYLRPGITIDISAIGPEYVTEDASKIEYTSSNNNFSTDYKAGIEIINNSGEKNYVYLNNSDCLIFLNETFHFNRSVCDLNITNIDDFTFVNNTVYLINLTEIQVCNIDSGNFVCSDENDTNLTSLNFSKIGGVSYNAFLGPEGRIFVSAQNSSGENKVYLYNSSNLTTPLHEWYVPDCYVGKMLFSEDGGFGIGNNSGRYTFYKIFMGEGDFSCDKPVNLTEGLIVKGFAEDPFEEKYYIVNGSGGVVNINFFVSDYGFRYQFKDKKLGYGVEESFNELKYNSRVYLPADRNYSFMIYPQGGPAFPVSIELNNLTRGGNNISLGTTENRTITSINQAALYLNLSDLNLTTEMVQLSGYSLFNDKTADFDNYTIIAYLLEAGNMVFSKGMMPQNMGQKTGQNINDVFNKTSGFYNMTLPAAAYGADILLFATAKKDGKWYGGFRTVSLTYGETPGQLDITVYPMVGNEATLESQFLEFGEPANTSLFSFNISARNGENITEVTNVHSEISVDYSNLNGSNVTFYWMADSGDTNIIKIPLLNESATIKIFSPQYPPIKKTVAKGDMQEGVYNITLESLKAKKPNGEILDVQFRNFEYKDDGSCSVPWPSETPGAGGCLPDGVGNGGGPVNPFTWVISGGKYDLEMRQTATNITVHYVNVDLLASQPPDARFDDSGNRTIGGSSLREAWRFGSMGPNIYDYVIIGVPYNNSVINESLDMRVNITKFHDENWQPVWEQGDGLDSLNGTEYEDYKAGGYEEYINGSAVWCNSSDANLTSDLCYKDITNKMLWFKIPHFSGIEPTIIGQAISSSSEESNEGNSNAGSSGGSGGSIVSKWVKEIKLNDSELNLGRTLKELKKNYRINFNVSGMGHYLGITNITNTSVTVEVASTPQTATLLIGEEKKFEVTDDNYYDIYVKLNSITNNKADMTIKSIHEEIPTTTPTPSTTPPSTTTPATPTTPVTSPTTPTATGNEGKQLLNTLFIIIAAIVIIIAAALIIKKKK